MFPGTAITGKVKWFNVKRAYGFVCRDDNKEDIFIHQSAIVKSNPEHLRKSVEDGEEILFDIVQGEKGLEAANVSAVDGQCVRGSEYALRFPRGRGRGRGGRGGFRGRGKSRDVSEEGEPLQRDYFRGPPPPPRGRPFFARRPFPRAFRGGRPFAVPFIEPYPNYEIPHDYFYDFDAGYYDQMRPMPRGRFNGPRFRGGISRDGPMKGGDGGFDGEYFERRGPGGRGRPRARGRGGGRGRARGDQWSNGKGGDSSGQAPLNEGDMQQQQQHADDN